MPFSDNLVNTIHDKISLSDYIGRSVNLLKKGNDFIGLCPFHNEKTPSFTVSDDKGFFHCFGCGAHGDIISFVMQKESIDFKETIKILASEIGVNIEDYSSKDKKSIEEEINYKNIYDLTKSYFKNNFNSESGNKVKGTSCLGTSTITNKKLNKFINKFDSNILSKDEFYYPNNSLCIIYQLILRNLNDKENIYFVRPGLYNLIK